MSRLQVLLVEDEPDDLTQYERDFPSVFTSNNIEADIHPCSNFNEAFALTTNPLYRYDLIVSDTYRGPTKDKDAQVMKMVSNYRGSRFCPLVVYSSGVKPPDLQETAFILWADKGRRGDIERAIKQLLDTNIPQLARKLHEELERSAGSYLWDFLEKYWDQIGTKQSSDLLERLIRRRASIKIGRLNTECTEVQCIEGLEYYLYPPTSADFRLGDIIKRKENDSILVLITPHCHLTIQTGADAPRADYILAVKTIGFDEIIKKNYPENTNPWKGTKKEMLDKLRRRTQSPAQLGQPDGRYWFLPPFLEIPEMYCDFLQIESIKLEDLNREYRRIATLDAPFAEALQSCFIRFFSSVGLSTLNYKKYEYLIERTKTETS